MVRDEDDFRRGWGPVVLCFKGSEPQKEENQEYRLVDHSVLLGCRRIGQVK